jgi:hypothetical protein
LQAEGINVSHEDGVWQLKIGELDVPGAFFDEDGEGLHITDGEKQIDIPVEDAADRLQINADGLLLLNDGKGVNIGMFNPAAPEAGWMFFDYKAVNIAEINVEQLSGVSEVDLVMDEAGNVHLPNDLILFENANAKPFHPDAVPSDWGYKEFDASRKVFSGQMTPEREKLWFGGDFADNPALRDKRSAFVFKVSDEDAALLGVPGGDLWIVSNQYMNKPEEGEEKTGGFFHVIIPGDTLRKFIEMGFFDGGGFLIPALVSSHDFSEMYPGDYRILTRRVYEKQGLRQADVARILRAAGEIDAMTDEAERTIFVAEYTHNPWNGQSFYLNR